MKKSDCHALPRWSVGLNAVSMAAKAKASEEQETDVLLIGGGIMSATLGDLFTRAGA